MDPADSTELDDVQPETLIWDRLCPVCRKLDLESMIKLASQSTVSRIVQSETKPCSNPEGEVEAITAQLSKFEGVSEAYKRWDLWDEYPGTIFNPNNLVRIAPASDCSLCRFLGSGLGKTKDTTADVAVHCMRMLKPFQYVFEPCAIYLQLANDKERAAYDYDERYILPVAKRIISATPHPPYMPLRPQCVDLSIFRKWITHCDDHHHRLCSPGTPVEDDGKSPNIMGFKLIECASGNVVPGTLKARYAALSYVWGTGTQSYLRPESGSLAVPRDRLPKTIQDALTVAKELGLEYLWVDKYCINQTDDSELHDQISHMDKVYQYATLTIIAAAGNDSESGLPGIRADSRAPQPRLIIDGTTWVSVLARPSDAIEHSRWNTRAWTFQEGFFARKRLIFTEEQVIFQCNTSSCCELAEPTPKLAPNQGRTVQNDWLVQVHFRKAQHPSWLRNGRTNDRDLFGTAYPSLSCPDGRWHIRQRIQHYSGTELSYQTDALNAVRAFFLSLAEVDQSGLTKDIQAKPLFFFWGIPMEVAAYTFDESHESVSQVLSQLSSVQRSYAALQLGMLWRTARGPGLSAHRRRQFPSWSWLGWIANIFWVFEIPMDVDLATQIWLHTLTGQRIEFTGSIPKALTHDRVMESELYTHRLEIETQAFKVKLSYSPHVGKRGGTHAGYVITIQRLGIRSYIGRFDLESETFDLLVWPVDTTASLESNKADHDALLAQELTCAVMYGHYGLLLSTVDGVSERVGLVKLDAEFCSSSKRLWEEPGEIETLLRLLDYDIPHHERCLKTYFECKKETILLE